jgi:transketolase
MVTRMPKSLLGARSRRQRQRIGKSDSSCKAWLDCTIKPNLAVPVGVYLVMRTFGASAPLEALKRKLGFTPERVYAAAKRQIERSSKA